MGSNKVSVRIYGQEYVISGDKSQEHMIRVAAYVDNKMSELGSLFKKSPVSSLAVLSAVNIADEYFTVMQKIDESKITNEQMEGDIHRYEQLWEEAKKTLSDQRKETQDVIREKEELAEKLREKERQIEELLKGEKNIEAEVEKHKAITEAETEEKYKDLENNFFDLQMENIQLKSEVEKLKSRIEQEF